MSGTLVVRETPEALAGHVAEWLIGRVAGQAGTARIALSGGSTPKLLFAKLSSHECSARIPWARVHLYWGDERFVPYDHPDSNYGMTRAALLDKVAVPEANVHPMPTDGVPADAAARYERLLQQAYGAAVLEPSRPLFDVVFLGLGEDGHTASLIPGQPVLDERTRWVAPVEHGRKEVRLTLTYPVLESSRAVAFLVTGAGKAAILREVRSGRSDVPAARLKPSGELIWFVDRAAAGTDQSERGVPPDT
jgi:6-phosphogluconolactonase